MPSTLRMTPGQRATVTGRVTEIETEFSPYEGARRTVTVEQDDTDTITPIIPPRMARTGTTKGENTMQEKTETKAVLATDRGSVTAVHTDREAYTLRLVAAGPNGGGARLNVPQLRDLSKYLAAKAEELNKAETTAKEKKAQAEREARARVQREMYGFRAYPYFR
ncbi:hypothetical protein [Streptomyces sp. SID14515]|uniref:hypothetical protein n=1 Tax=Streptomyces sp. SID14515 TaxID=2706074 RepID=UPI0013CB2325|nr:hypothetical protein [Streptomyces sp. SID14515]NEB35897.1 hypothetical protein [Streptomyces sp. SID14515]